MTWLWMACNASRMSKRARIASGDESQETTEGRNDRGATPDPFARGDVFVSLFSEGFPTVLASNRRSNRRVCDMLSDAVGHNVSCDGGPAYGSPEAAEVEEDLVVIPTDDSVEVDPQARPNTSSVESELAAILSGRSFARVRVRRRITHNFATRGRMRRGPLLRANSREDIETVDLTC